jgi:LssY-like putative type I secretion system component LssY
MNRRKRSHWRWVIVLTVALGLVFSAVLLVRFYPYSENFATFPRLTRTASGATGVAGDPINLVFIGSQEQITQSFHQAGWLTPDPITPQTTARIAAASLAHRSYPMAPISNLYAFGRVQDMAFEKPTNDVQNRGHIRLWTTGTFIGGQNVWAGQASYDSGIELGATSHFPTHHIAPTVDWERNSVGSDLARTGHIKSEVEAAFTTPIFAAHNGGGDLYVSDGDVLVINYTSASVPLHPPTLLVSGLKDGIFFLYDILVTAPGIFGAILLIGAVVIVGFALVRIRRRQRNAPAKRSSSGARDAETLES